MQLITNAVRYDWQTWFMGIMRSWISGGASSLANTGIASALLPQQINLGKGLHTLLTFTVLSFLGGAIIHLAIFLSTHGAPEPVKNGP
jgi:hypothetical protein